MGTKTEFLIFKESNGLIQTWAIMQKRPSGVTEILCSGITDKGYAEFLMKLIRDNPYNPF
jgi:hypothetical protein